MQCDRSVETLLTCVKVLVCLVVSVYAVGNECLIVAVYVVGSECVALLMSLETLLTSIKMMLFVVIICITL